MVGQEDTIVFAVIEGALDFVDDKGNTMATENWQTFLKRPRSLRRKRPAAGRHHKILAPRAYPLWVFSSTPRPVPDPQGQPLCAISHGECFFPSGP